MKTTTRTKRLLTGWMLLLSASLAGCAGSNRGVVAKERTQSGAYAEQSSPAPQASYSMAEESAPATPSAPPGAAMDGAMKRKEATSERAPSPSERPGLGTEWGETRYSHVSETRFLRADPMRPSEVASLYYNDSEGARAMTHYQDYREIGNAVVTVPWLGVTVSLNDEGGSPLPAFYAGGRTYAIGEAGHRYTIVVNNGAGSPFEVVASVDGLDVLDGKSASYGKRGYLVPAGGSVEIDGFRQSDEHVAAFRFGSVRDSYAARTGTDRN